MSEFSPRALGWSPPAPSVKATLRYAGPRASDFLFGVEPVDSADNRGFCVVLDQGQLRSCVANACNQIIRAEMLRTGARAPEVPARLWAYELALTRQGTPGRDVGTNLGTCMDVLAEFGYPPESRMPYDLQSFGTAPSPHVWQGSVDQRAPGGLCYHQIEEQGTARVLAIRQALTEGHLVAFGTQVSEEFCSSQPAKLVEPPKPSDKIAGGHAMCWVGYDAISGPARYRALNSWGPEFGDGGFFWMSEAYVTWAGTQDLWIVRNVPHYSSEVQQ